MKVDVLDVAEHSLQMAVVLTQMYAEGVRLIDVDEIGVFDLEPDTREAGTREVIEAYAVALSAAALASERVQSVAAEWREYTLAEAACTIKVLRARLGVVEQ